MDPFIRRNRLIYTLMIILVLLLGLASRQNAAHFPDFLATYLGDTLWASLVYLLIVWKWPTISPLKAGGWALLFAFGIEFSQLYQAEWINSLRQNRWVAMVLGRGFLWVDLICYSVGVALFAGLDILGYSFLKQKKYYRA